MVGPGQQQHSSKVLIWVWRWLVALVRGTAGFDSLEREDTGDVGFGVSSLGTHTGSLGRECMSRKTIGS